MKAYTINRYCSIISFNFLFIVCVFAQPDSVQLEVNGSVQLNKTGTLLSRLILNTVSQNDPGRYGIQFSNNIVAPFLGDDFDHQHYNFYTKWSENRDFDAVLNIHGRAANDWGRKLSLTHDGTDGFISTDKGHLVFNPNSNKVGINTSDPTDNLEVQGSLALDGGGGLGVIRIRQNDSLRWTFLTAPWIGGNDLRIRNEGKGDDKDVMIFDRETSNVGVALDTPLVKFHVRGDHLRLESKADNNRYIQFRTDGTALDLDAIGAPLYVQAGSFLAMGIGGTKVGVGLDTPSVKFHVLGDHLRLSSVAHADRYIQFRTDGTALDLDAIGAPLYIQAGSFLAMGLGVTNVGIGTDNPGYKLQVGEAGDGSEARANAWETLSDLRFKKDIHSLDNVISKIKRLNGYYYNWKNNDSLPREVGVIAQEVEAVLPELVSTGPDGYKSVDYGKMAALFIEVLKVHNDKIEQQDAQIRKLQSEIEQLKMDK